MHLYYGLIVSTKMLSWYLCNFNIVQYLEPFKTSNLFFRLTFTWEACLVARWRNTNFTWSTELKVKPSATSIWLATRISPWSFLMPYHQRISPISDGIPESLPSRCTERRQLLDTWSSSLQRYMSLRSVNHFNFSSDVCYLICFKLGIHPQ